MTTQQEIRTLRIARGLSQEKLAQLCGLTSQTIYRAEKTGKIHINQFMYKYEQLVEYKVYNEKVAKLLSSYQYRVQLLLNNKHLANGTSV